MIDRYLDTWSKVRKSEQYFDYIKSDTYIIACPLIALSYRLTILWLHKARHMHNPLIGLFRGLFPNQVFN